MVMKLGSDNMCKLCNHACQDWVVHKALSDSAVYVESQNKIAQILAAVPYHFETSLQAALYAHGNCGLFS